MQYFVCFLSFLLGGFFLYLGAHNGLVIILGFILIVGPQIALNMAYSVDRQRGTCTLPMRCMNIVMNFYVFLIGSDLFMRCLFTETLANRTITLIVSILIITIAIITFIKRIFPKSNSTSGSSTAGDVAGGCLDVFSYW